MTLPIDKKVELKIEGKTYQVEIKSLTAERARVEVDGKEIHVNISIPRDSARASAPMPGGSQPSSQFEGATRSASAPATQAVLRPAPASAKSLLSLMPGVVIKILVKEGQQVAAGDVLLVLEAMKMENEIRSDRSGTIGSIDVTAGQQVQTGDPLVSFA